MRACWQGERWIGFPPSRGERDSSGHVLARQLIRAGLHDADVTLIDSLTAQKRLAQAGFGLALVPESSVRDELRRGVARGARRAGDADGHPDRRDPPPQRLSQSRRHDTAGAVDGRVGAVGSLHVLHASKRTMKHWKPFDRASWEGSTYA